MSPRDTTSGGVLENTVLPALKKYYKYDKQIVRPQLSFGGPRHRIDVLLEDPDKADKQILISLKWQGTSGTAEEKVPYEMIKLVHAIDEGEGKYERAYIIIAGPGFTPKLRDYYFSGQLKKYIVGYEKLKIISLDEFINLANRKRL